MQKQMRFLDFIFFPKDEYYYSQSDETKHFLLTQFQTLLLAILITVLMQFSNHLAIYLIYLCPIYFLIVIVEYFIFWKIKDFETEFHIFNASSLIICLPIFFGVFFGVFHPTASLDFKQAQNCQMVGSLSDSIEGYEKYAILYINFELDGEQYLGAACSSDQNQGSTSASINPYKFFYKFDGLLCGKDESENTDSNDSRRLSQIYSANNTKHRFLDGDSTDNSCTRSYLWSKVKIASWICLERGFALEQYLEKQSCYVHFFSGSQAVKNGLQRSSMKDEYNFPLVSYYPKPYYPEADVVCLIIFTYYFWLLSFNSIFYYTSHYCFRKLHQFQQEMEYIVHKQQNEYDFD